MTSSPASLSCIDLRGRVAVVTGGANGIGRATAFLMAKSGARVFVGDVDQNPSRLQEFDQHQIAFLHCDVRDSLQIKELIDQAAALGGRLDFLVNNAGVNCVGQADEIDESEWDRCFNINLRAAFLGTKHALPHFRRGGGGVIVNTSSNAGLMPRVHDPVYSTSKMALIGLTKSLALCHAVDRIRVNCVCPGPVAETLIMEGTLAREANREEAIQKYLKASPLAHAHGRMIAPEEVAQAIVYLCSDAAAMVTGTAIAIDGGKSLGVPPVLS